MALVIGPVQEKSLVFFRQAYFFMKVAESTSKR